MTDAISDLSFRTLFDIVASALILADEKGNVVLANHAALILFSYSHEDICKLKVEALMPAYHREHHEAHRNSYIRKPEKPSISNGRSLSILRSDGKELSVDISLTPLKTEEQLYTLATFGPADRRKAAEEAFRVSEERLKLATQAAYLAIFDLDLNNNFIHWDESIHTSAVPEPESYAMMLAGLGLMDFVAKRRKSLNS